MAEELKIERININIVANGFYVRVEYEEVDDEWNVDKFIFETKEEVLLFLENHLD